MVENFIGGKLMAIKQDNFEYPDGIDYITKELFQEAEDKLHKKFKRYSESIKRSLSLNDMNIREKSLIAPTIHHGYINCLFAEQSYLRKLERALDLKRVEYKEKYGVTDVPRYKAEDVIKNEKVIRVLNDNISLQKEIIKYLEDVCKVLSTFGFSVKNSVELMKLM